MLRGCFLPIVAQDNNLGNTFMRPVHMAYRNGAIHVCQRKIGIIPRTGVLRTAGPVASGPLFDELPFIWLIISLQGDISRTFSLLPGDHLAIGVVKVGVGISAVYIQQMNIFGIMSQGFIMASIAVLGEHR